MSLTLDQQAVKLGFIPTGEKVKNIQARDIRGLRAVKGSYEAIAARMETILPQIPLVRELREVERARIFSSHGYNHTELSAVPGDLFDMETEAGRVYSDVHRLFSTPMEMPGVPGLALVTTHNVGSRSCRELYLKCGGQRAAKGAEARVVNLDTGRGTVVSPLIAHLVSDHHFLPRVVPGKNDASLVSNKEDLVVSARDFYEHFM